MKRTSNRVKYWVIYDAAYSGGDEGIGWTSNSFIAKTYFIFRKKNPNKDTIFIEELDLYCQYFQKSMMNLVTITVRKE